MITKEQYQKAIEVVENYLSQIQEERLDEDTMYWYKYHSKLLGITEDDLLINIASVRLLNILKKNREHLNIDLKPSTSIKELSKISFMQLKSCKNCGPNTLWELRAICYYAQIRLKV